MKLQQSEKRVKIAEFCGIQTVYWKSKYNNHGEKAYHVSKTKKEAENWPFKELGVEPFIFLEKIPDYFNDLNAMHEAEKLFINPHSDRRVRQSYRNWLHKLNRGQVWSATAAQRAEAFGKALNLW